VSEEPWWLTVVLTHPTTVPPRVLAVATNLVDYSLLTPAEKKWLKEHNEQIKKEVGPLLRSDRRAKKWLDKQ
jgi:hypothetical protein